MPLFFKCGIHKRLKKLKQFTTWNKTQSKQLLRHDSPANFITNFFRESVANGMSTTPWRMHAKGSSPVKNKR
jgi:hypothetical protein